jgi:hypothetical protein
LSQITSTTVVTFTRPHIRSPIARIHQTSQMHLQPVNPSHIELFLTPPATFTKSQFAILHAKCHQDIHAFFRPPCPALPCPALPRVLPAAAQNNKVSAFRNMSRSNVSKHPTSSLHHTVHYTPFVSRHATGTPSDFSNGAPCLGDRQEWTDTSSIRVKHSRQGLVAWRGVIPPSVFLVNLLYPMSAGGSCCASTWVVCRFV